MHYICASAAQELAPEIAARIAEAERIAAEAEAEAAAYAEHAAAIQAEHDLQQQQEHQVHPLTCLSFRLLMLPVYIEIKVFASYVWFFTTHKYSHWSSTAQVQLQHMQRALRQTVSNAIFLMSRTSIKYTSVVM